MNASIDTDRFPLWRWWRRTIVRTVDHVGVMEKVRNDGHWSGRYAFMILMSGGIAMLGLLLSSPAVVIGAMLISPLMGPIIGLGFGLATFDSREIRASAIALLGGIVLAVLFCALIVIFSPLQNVTDEIAARTRPNLFDLLVALFSALAGAYAMIRGREGTIVGAAIATALMPPLATVGFGLAIANWTVFGGALLLFFTNLMTIALSAALMARIYGFGTSLSPQQTMLQTVLALISFAALAVPLGLSLKQIAWEVGAGRQARAVLAAQFSPDARLSQVDLDYAAHPLRVVATVLTPELRPQAQAETAEALTRLFDQPVEVKINQYRVGTTAQAEASAIKNAEGQAGSAEAVTVRLTNMLSVMAGVDPDQVLIDAAKRRAYVRATPLPGANLTAYRTLEARLTTAEKGWQVMLVPPRLPLGEITVSEDGPDKTGLADAAWAAVRRGEPIEISGPATLADTVEASLKSAGVTTLRGAESGPLRLRWSTP
ncbi:DUF389 domain-containing protein [Sphingomonas sp. G-3-2-10]|uniref:DUF389 domain-containing protein n=1 Tax=Sphingomonas sp. G-3-2-10 TaxID=2728838 RepID=UPI00146CF98B|nr:DUF389 domain-containing protein [Sphingomonas sp. G-3-2-10]NML07386.1 DUF389 domain-containing protein [Sphingomonas sp. G-3-2-10]